MQVKQKFVIPFHRIEHPGVCRFYCGSNKLPFRWIGDKEISCVKWTRQCGTEEGKKPVCCSVAAVQESRSAIGLCAMQRCRVHCSAIWGQFQQRGIFALILYLNRMKDILLPLLRRIGSQAGWWDGQSNNYICIYIWTHILLV